MCVQTPVGGGTLTAEMLLADHTAKVRRIVSRLRKLVRDCLPEATEQVYAGWHALGYRQRSAGYLCGIFPYEQECRLYFEHGHALPDPAGILQGISKQTRYAVCGDERALPEAELAALLRAALIYGEARKLKRRTR